MGIKRARDYDKPATTSYKKRNINARDEDNSVYYTGSVGAPRQNYSSVPRTRGAACTGEMKYYDTFQNKPIQKLTTTWANTLADPTGKDCLFVPVVGAGVSNRIGKAAKLLKLKIKGFVNVPPVSVAEPDVNPNIMVRILLVWDKQTNATQMTGPLLLNGGTEAEDTIMTFQNIDNFGRFVVLKDKIINLSNLNMVEATSPYQVGVNRPFKFNHNFKTPVEVRFNALGTEAVGSLVDHSFHIVAGCTGGAGTPEIIYSCRACFKE